MLTIAVLYYIYLAVLLFFFVYSLFNIYHLIRFGFASTINIVVIILYIGVSTAFIVFSFNLLLAIDWTIPLVDFSTGTPNNIGI
jgi:hypothetical protein